MRLEDVLKSLEIAKVTVRGAELDVRPLSAAEVGAMEAQTPDPIMRRKPHAGGARHGMVDDPDHPEYKRELERNNTRRYALRAAIGLGVEAPGGVGAWKPDMAREQVIALADHVLGFFTWRELSSIVGAQEGVKHPSAAAEADRIGTESTRGN